MIIDFLEALQMFFDWPVHCYLNLTTRPNQQDLGQVRSAIVFSHVSTLDILLGEKSKNPTFCLVQ
jgi:hypothetical protein